jgi:hypothetical protein
VITNNNGNQCSFTIVITNKNGSQCRVIFSSSYLPVKSLKNEK